MKTEQVETKCLVVEAKQYLVGQPSPMEACARWSNYLNAKRKCKCGNCPTD